MSKLISSVTLSLVVFVLGAGVYAEESGHKIVQFSLQIQTKEMETPAFFALEMVPTALKDPNQEGNLALRTSRVIRGIWGLNLEGKLQTKLENAFKGIPDIKASLYNNLREKELCITFEGDINGMNVQSNLKDLKTLYGSYTGISVPNSDAYCFDVLKELDEHKTVYAVLTSDREFRDDGSKELRKRVALYIHYLY